MYNINKGRGRTRETGDIVIKTEPLRSCNHGNLRGNYLLAVDKLGVGHGLPVAFEHHDGLLSVAEIVGVDAVVCGGTTTIHDSLSVARCSGARAMCPTRVAS